MPDSPNGAEPSLVLEDSDPGEVDESLNELHQQVAASEERIADLERDLGKAADQEAETAKRQAPRLPSQIREQFLLPEPEPRWWQRRGR